MYPESPLDEEVNKKHDYRDQISAPKMKTFLGSAPSFIRSDRPPVRRY